MVSHDLSRFHDKVAVLVFQSCHALVHDDLSDVSEFDNFRPWVYLIYPCSTRLLPQEVSPKQVLSLGHVAAVPDMWQVFLVMFVPRFVVVYGVVV